MQRVDYMEILDVFLWGVYQLSRPTLYNLLAGYPEFSRREQMVRLVQRLEHGRLISRTGQGEQATFAITTRGMRFRRRIEPLTAWETPWDGSWRLLMFDVPESRRQDRKRLWRALRDRKFGFLQRSVWIWPHDLRPILQEILQAEGIPECFCGFSAQDLFLCTKAEIVTTAWDFREIERRQKAYERHPAVSTSGLERISTIASLVGAARAERQAYEYAFSLDPLLPSVLWPKNYRGQTVLSTHQRFRLHLGRRLAQLAKL
jgi:phenylacetic acid degradation operon negative regulatory protein